MPSTTITFDREDPPARVFDSIADARNELKWQKDIGALLSPGLRNEMAKRPRQFREALARDPA